MECACTVGTCDDYDPVLMLDTTTPKARKEHICDECHRIIHVGEQYRKDVYTFEGRLWQHKYCEDCLALRRVFFNNGGVYGTLWGDMEDFIYNCGGELSVRCMLELTKPALYKVCDLIEKTWEEE